MWKFYLKEIIDKRNETSAEKWTQEKIAELTGLGYTTVNRIYHNSGRRVDIEVLNKLTQKLKLESGEELFRYTSED